MDDPFQIATLHVDPSSRRITSGAAEMTVSPRAMGVLSTLRQSGMRVTSRDALLDAVWPDVTVTDESLTQAVAELRRAFKALGADRDLVVTVPKAGYRLDADPTPRGAPPCGQTETAPPMPMDVYCMIVEAQTALVRADDDALELATSLARDAVGRAPASALAHATYSIMLVHETLYSAGSRDNLGLACDHAETAVRLAPDSAFNHASLGFALGAADGDTSAYYALVRGLMQTDGNGEAHYLAARVAFIAGDHRAAATLALRSAERVSDASRPLFLAARSAWHFDPASSASIARRCVRTLERRLADDPDEPRSRHTVGPALALAGDAESGWNTISAQRSNRSICSIHDLFGLAHIRDDAGALDALENALDDGFRHGLWLMREPMLAGLRENRRFKRLTAALSAE